MCPPAFSTIDLEIDKPRPFPLELLSAPLEKNGSKILLISCLDMPIPVSAKFIKHLENTELYEMRVSIGNNEYRTIMFTMDNPNVILATKIILLNAFMKKSTKDYKKQLRTAEKILGGLLYDED